MPNQKNKKITYDIYDTKGEKISKGSLTSEIRDTSKYEKLITQVVRVYLTNQRQGTSSTKTRGEVIGSTRKIYRQKGTGRARHGDIKAPIFSGGGIVFGPKPRDLELRLNKKMKKKAFYVSVMDKIKNNKFIVIKGFAKFPVKTKDFFQLLKKILAKKKDFGKILLISQDNRNLLLSARNIPGITQASPGTVNTYEILSHEKVFVDADILEKLFSRLGIGTGVNKRKTV